MMSVTDKKMNRALDPSGLEKILHRKRVLVYAIVLLLFVVGLWMRLHTLALPFDRDSYDEGVYWQSLRSMSTGAPLYQQIFYSQPPFFLLSLFPTYLLGGQSIWSARLGIVVISLAGLLGAFLLGKALRGYVGAVAALLLLISTAPYLAESQIVQADGPCAALSLLAVGLAYLWWNHPEGRRGTWLAALTALTLVAAILTKLFAVAALIPIGLLILAHLWRVLQQPAETRLLALRSLLVGIVAGVIALLLLVLPFLPSFAQMWREVITFHTVAGAIYHPLRAENKNLLLSSLNTPLTYIALFAACLALLQRDWRVLPLLAWLLTTIVLLWQQTPLFVHHMVMLIPPLIALTITGLASQRAPRNRTFAAAMTIATLLLILTVTALDLQEVRSHYTGVQAQGQGAGTQANLQVANDLRAVTQPGELVISDAQFIVALAGRNTPAELVDTSNVRLSTGYVTDAQMIQAAARPQVHAVLFYTGRLAPRTEFQHWVSQHFTLVHDYGAGKGLWVKIK